MLSGHSHSYERSYLIDGYYGFTWDFNETNKKDAGDGRRRRGRSVRQTRRRVLQAHAGAVYTVAGSSGQISGGTLDHPAMSLSSTCSAPLVIDVNGDRLDAKFLDDLGVVRDSFSIVKQP